MKIISKAKATSAKSSKSKPVASKSKPVASKSKSKPVATPVVRQHKTGLRMFQVRVLRILNSHDDIPIANISQRVPFSTKFAILAIGPADEAARIETDKRNGFPCLLTLKAVKISSTEGRANCFSITTAGKQLLAKYLSENGKQLPPKAKNGQE